MSKKTVRSFYIVGTENTFTNHFSARMESYDNHLFEYEFEIGDWDNFIKTNSSKNYNAVIVQIYNDEKLVNHNLQMTLFCKSSDTFKSIPFIALINHNDHIIRNNSLLYRIGFSYIHMYGDSIKLLCSNLYYIIYEDETYSEKWAMAKGFELPTKIFHPAFVRKFNEEVVILFSDVLLEEYNNITIDFFDDFTPVGFDSMGEEKIQSVEGEFRQDLYIKFSDSWQTQGSPFFQDSLESWINVSLENNEIIRDKLMNLMVYSSKTSFFTHYFLNKKNIKLKHHYEFKNIEQISTCCPIDIVIYQINSKEDLENFEKLVLCVSQDYKYDPIIIVVNHPSFSEALQKLYNYDHIISCKEETYAKLLDDMLKILEAKKENNSTFYVTKELKDSYISSLPVDIKVTSLTENEITFKTSFEFPFYTNLKIDLPIKDLLITIVPPYFDLSPNIHGFHYMGIINGVSEAQRQNLRRVVSHFIANPPKELSLVDLSKIGREEEIADKKEFEEKKKQYIEQQELKNKGEVVKEKDDQSRFKNSRSKSSNNWSKL